MDNAEEPQKKIFKARKTMKASDRQQLEAIHKAKEEVLKPAEIKLLNGTHENGDSDVKPSHRDLGYMAGKRDINGILDVNSDVHEVPVVKLSDIREGLRGSEQTKDLKVTLELQPIDSSACKENEKTVESAENDSETFTGKEEENAFLIKVDHKTSEDSPEDNPETQDAEISDDKIKLNISLEEEIDVISGTVCAVEDDSLKELASVTAKHETIGLSVKEPNEGNVVEDNLKSTSELHDLDSKEHDGEVGISNDTPQYELESIDLHKRPDEVPEELSVKKVNATDSSIALEETQEMVVADGSNLEQNQVPDAVSENQDAGEEAISSSMEVDQNFKGDDEKNSSLASENVFKKSLPDLPNTDSDIVDSMETDDIIPILEKLAPVEDELNCFSKSDLPSDCDVNIDEPKGDLSPSKQDVVPNEGFLLLSDEEETLDPLTSEKKLSSPQVPSIDHSEEPAEKVEEAKEVSDAQELNAEKSLAMVTQRKRSKSEDLDSTSSKKRRYDGDEYEAELQVKITAGDDLNKKLHMVIQKMLDEKLTVLKCTVFDKTLANLKTRVENIECKKHEDVLHTIQAKIARLTKRFGAAKEDLKKRPEQTTTNQPASPVKTANEVTPNSNATCYRNTSTVRQMLESKRNVGESTPPATFQTPTTGQPLLPSPSILPLRNSTTTPISVNQSTANSSLQARAPPDWKLIQAKINASSIGASQNTLNNNQAKPTPPVTSAPVISSVLPAPSTATVVGNTQVSSSSSQPMPVSLQPLPVILHVPMAMPSQSQILQGTTGTLVTNQQSGNVEFIPVQNQSAVTSLNKTNSGTLATTKPLNSSSMPSPGIQRNSPASSIASTLTVQAATTHSVAQPRPPLQSVGTTSTYNQANNRTPSQLKSPLSGFNSSSTVESPNTSRQELQANRTPIAETSASKRTSDATTPSGKPGSGVIDLTLDDEDQETTSQDSRRTSSAAVSGSMQSSQTIGRPTPAQSSQPTSLQTPAVPTGPSQTTIHVLPTAQTTVNINQRQGAQVATRAPAPRNPNNQQMVYTTTTLPTVPVSTAVRGTLMQNQNLRQISPQTGGVPVRIPQTTAYVVNNGVSMGSAGPQLTVHHRPSQESVRPIHPAPLPEAPQPQRLPAEAAAFSAPQKPHLKLARVQSQNGIVLSWSVLEVDRTCAAVDSYHLYAYHEDPTATSASQWKKIGEVKALPLPMACTLTQFVSGSKYYFAVRAKDIYGRFGPFCDPQSTDVISTQSS